MARKTIMVYVGDGEYEEVIAHVYDGLAIHRPLHLYERHKQVDKGWTVTHIASGKCVVNFPHASFPAIRTVVLTLNELIDWKQDEKALRQDKNLSRLAFHLRSYSESNWVRYGPADFIRDYIRAVYADQPTPVLESHAQ